MKKVSSLTREQLSKRTLIGIGLALIFFLTSIFVGEVGILLLIFGFFALIIGIIYGLTWISKVNNSKFIEIVVYWVISLILLMLLIKLKISTSGDYGLFFLTSSARTDLLIIFILSLPLTVLVACRGKLKQIKEYIVDVINLEALVIFFLFAFYVWHLASYSALNIDLSSESFNNPDFYNLAYTVTVRGYYQYAIEKIIMLSIILFTIVGTLKILMKKKIT